MCTAWRELLEDSRAEGREEGRAEGRAEESWRCYLRAIALHMLPETACAVAGISEEEAKEAIQLREQEGKP